MDNKMIEDFARRYDVRVRYHNKADNMYGYSRTASYYDGFDSTVEVELSYRALEHLVKADDQAEHDYRANREEARMRKQYPALAEAYSKYKMLLELYK